MSEDEYSVYESLGEDTGDHRWAFGTGFVDALEGIDTAVPEGLNGYVAFVWDWVDENTMTEDGGLELNDYGRLVRDEVLRPLQVG